MALVEIGLRVTVTDSSGLNINRELPPTRFACASGLPKQEVVSLTGSAFTALSPPSGAKAVVIQPGTATTLTIKGITGDTGVASVPASNPIGGDMLLYLGSSPSIGILNGGSTAAVTLLWL